MNDYLGRLRDSALATGSIACMGLDSDMNALPETIRVDDIPNIYCDIFSLMKKRGIFPSAFKPNESCYLFLDNPRDKDKSKRHMNGTKALVQIMDMIEEMFPETPIILDNKRGDIASTSKNYAVSGLTRWGADAVTVHPYMGSDSVGPFIDEAMLERETRNGRGVYILNRTSNKGAVDLQSLEVKVGEGCLPLYMVVQKKIIDWGRGKPGVGAVVGATSLPELKTLVALYQQFNVPLLIPGVGSQGGSAKEVMQILRGEGYDLSLVRINSSSGITHPWKTRDKFPNNYSEVCVNALAKLNEEIGFKN